MGYVPGPHRPRDAIRTADGGWTWTNHDGVTTHLVPPQPMSWWQWAWRIPAGLLLLVGMLIATIVAFPALLAWHTMVDDYDPHPGELIGTIGGAITYYTTIGLTVWAWLTGDESWTEVLATGSVLFGVFGVMVFWAWIHYRRLNRAMR